MIEKSIEIYYDIKAIPGIATDDMGAALNFRNKAMEVIEAKLEEAQLGEWAGAEIGANLETGEPEVNFGFVVTDFDAAENVIRKAVAGTKFENIRQLARCELDLSDFQ